jgi:hypothetical protein
MKPLKRYTTDYLMPKSSFLQGFASSFNIAGNYYDFNFAKDGEDPDVKALQNDYKLVMQDLMDSFNKIKHQVNQDQIKLDFNPKEDGSFNE